MDKGVGTVPGARSEWSLFKIAFIVLCVFVGLYIVTNVLALVFPGLGIPFIWTAFPIGPQPPPIP